MDWKNKKFWMIVIAAVFLSSTFYGAFNTSTGGTKNIVTASIGVDFGSGNPYPKTYEFQNSSALEVLNRSVSSLKVENNEVKCISTICENENKTWNFYVNYNRINKEPGDYYPNNEDVMIFRFENKSSS